MNTKCIILIATYLINSCKSSDNHPFHFDPRTLEEKNFILSQIADEVSYIPLDNTYPLSYILNAKMTNGVIYFAAKDIGILSYNTEGKFLNRIGSIGRGPGEYLLGEFTIDDKSETICVLDINNIIKVYNRSGQYKRSFHLSGYGDNIENIRLYNSKLFVQYSVQFKNSDYEWIFCDTMGNIIKKKERRIPKFTANWGGHRPMYEFDDKIFYYNSFADTVFSILPDLTEKLSFIISPGEHRRPKSNLSLEQIASKEYMNIIKIFETSRFFVIIYHYKKYYLSLIGKHDQQYFLIDLQFENGNFGNGIKNDIDGGSLFVPEYYYTEDCREYMIGIQYPYQIKNRVGSKEFKNSHPEYPEKKYELEKLANDLNENDNPVLVLVRLKAKNN